MEKKDKVKEVKLYNATPDDNGNLSSIVTFENGDTGFNKHKGECKFVVGTEMPYVLEAKTSKKGTAYNTISMIKQPFVKGGGGGNFQMSIEDFIERKKYDTISYSMSYAKDLAQNKVIEPDKAIKLAEEWMIWQIAQIDKLYLKNKK